MNLNIFKRNKETENKDIGKEIISLTFKMPLINFLNYFKSNLKWEVYFSDKELTKIEKAIKLIKKGKPQDLVFEDELNIKKELARKV